MHLSKHLTQKPYETGLLFLHFRDRGVEAERGNIQTKGKPVLLSVIYPHRLWGRGPCVPDLEVPSSPVLCCFLTWLGTGVFSKSGSPSTRGVSSDGITSFAGRIFTMIGLFYNLYFNHFPESRSQVRCHPLPLPLQPFLQQYPKPSMWWPSPVCQPSSRYKNLSKTQVPLTVTGSHCEHDHLVWHDCALLFATS